MQGSTEAGGPHRLRTLVAATLIAISAVASLVLATGSPARPGAPAVAPALELVGNFTLPEYVTHAPGPANAGLLFVVEDAGTIRVVDRGRVLPRPFLDITRRVADSQEQGLLSVAFPPDYATSGLFYAYFTNNAGNNEIDEFQVSPGDPVDALETSRRRVTTFQHPGETNHNGGQLQFGPDGMLWIATGDGGGAADAFENAQDLNSRLGKLLRIDPRQTPSGAYSVPPDNPYVGVRGQDQIWAYGLRNPWRFSFDRNRIAIGDVGQGLWEEVDYETVARARGANFGWDNYEGAHLFEGPVLTRHELPVLEYSSDSPTPNCAVTGGYVVRDPALADLVGRYVYADFCDGQLRSFVPTLAGAVDDGPLGVQVGQPSAFGEGRRERLYVASLSGPVYRLIPQ